MPKRIYIILFLVFFLLITIVAPGLAAEPTDISNHWAQDYILNLVNNDIMQTYQDGSFKPEQPISRGDFASALAKEIHLMPENKLYFADLQDYPEYRMVSALVKEDIIGGYPDGSFKPNQPITRAEAVTVMAKALGLNDDKVMLNLDNYQPFKDIPQNHWALEQIKVTAKLGLVEGDQTGYFYPKREITRAEAAKYLVKLGDLSSNTGYLTDIYPTSRKVSVNLLEGERVILNYSQDTLVGRNNRLVELEEILNTDKIFIITDNKDEVKYVKAYGMVTQEDLATEVSTMTNGFLEPAEVKNLADGDINILKPKVQTAVKNQLRSQGLTTDEVAAIMSTDWDKLEDLSKVRLAEAVAIETGLPLDITKGILNGDWEKIKNYAQIEVIQRLVQEVLDSNFLS